MQLTDSDSMANDDLILTDTLPSFHCFFFNFHYDQPESLIFYQNEIKLL